MQNLSKKHSQKLAQTGVGLALVTLVSAMAAVPANACPWGHIFEGLVKTSANMAKEPFEILSVPFRMHESGTPVYQTTKTTTTTPAK